MDNLSKFYGEARGILLEWRGRCRICRITCESFAGHGGDARRFLPNSIVDVFGALGNGYGDRISCPTRLMGFNEHRVLCRREIFGSR